MSSKGTFMVTMTVTYAVADIDPTDIPETMFYIAQRGGTDMDGVSYVDTRDIYWDETDDDGTLMDNGRSGQAKASEG